MILVHPYFEHEEYNNSIATAQIIESYDHILSTTPTTKR